VLAGDAFGGRRIPPLQGVEQSPMLVLRLRQILRQEDDKPY